MSDSLKCSFCGKSEHEVRKIVAGPQVFICNECTELVVDILVDENILPTNAPPGEFNEKALHELHVCLGDTAEILAAVSRNEFDAVEKLGSQVSDLSARLVILRRSNMRLASSA